LRRKGLLKNAKDAAPNNSEINPSNFTIYSEKLQGFNQNNGEEGQYFEKNQVFICVRTKEESAYAKYLEGRKKIMTYEAGSPLIPERVQ
jgi:hypothetical protein